jgi:hypothetical protein
MQIYTGFAAKRRLIISSNPANSKNFPEYSKYCVYISGLLQKTSQKLSHCHITLIFTPNNHKQRLDFFLDHQCAAAWLPFKLFASKLSDSKKLHFYFYPLPLSISILSVPLSLSFRYIHSTSLSLLIAHSALSFLSFHPIPIFSPLVPTSKSLPTYSGISSVIHLSCILLYLDSLILSLLSCFSVFLSRSLFLLRVFFSALC